MPPVFGPAVAVEDPLVVLRRRQRHDVLAVAERQQRELLALEELLQHHGRSAPKRRSVKKTSTAARASASVGADDHALAGGEPVGLEHRRVGGAGEVLERLLAAAQEDVAGGRHPGLLHQLLGEGLRALQLGRRARSVRRPAPRPPRARRRRRRPAPPRARRRPGRRRRSPAARRSPRRRRRRRPAGTRRRRRSRRCRARRAPRGRGPSAAAPARSRARAPLRRRPGPSSDELRATSGQLRRPASRSASGWSSSRASRARPRPWPSSSRRAPRSR